MAEIVRDGCRIWYTVEGPRDGPALLLSNSLGTSLELWDSTVPLLASRFRIVRYDTRGHGRSDAPAGPYSLELLGRDAVAVLDGAGIGPAAVCGISLGGLTATWLGLHEADRVTRLILANTGAQIGSLSLWNERIAAVEANGLAGIVDRLLERWFTAGFRAAHPETIVQYRAMLEATPAAGYVGCCAAVRDADLRADLSLIKCPTLVVVGTADGATPPSLGELLRDRIRGARLVALEAAHLSNVEQPASFAQAVRNFLDE
jgi:3-oxoadipate enol-lactonase